MNFKKIGLPVMLFCSAGLLGSCTGNTGYKEVYYDEAKTWVTNNFGAGEKTPTYKLPKSTTTDYMLGGYLTKFSGDYAKTLGYFKNHICNFLIGYTYLSTETVTNSVVKSASTIEAAWNLGGEKKNEVDLDETNCYPVLNGSTFDTILSTWFFNGFSKNAAIYTVNSHNKSFKATGTFNFSIRDEENSGTHYLVMPNCSIDFNKDGTMNSISFNFASNSFCNYYWESDTASWSAAFSWAMYQGSYITVNFNY